MNHAVLVGINAYKQVSGLSGCVNDVEDVAAALTASAGVPKASIVKLLDAQATKAAIISALKDMLGKLKFGERAYLHFSGHGVQLPSADMEEPDGVDEVLCAYDFDWTAASAVVDDELYRLLLDRAPGSEVIITLDCCHSGDQTRDARVKPRTLQPPPAVAAELLRRRGRVRSLRSVSRSPGVAFLSACSPWEVAADTAFEGRPNGAFTYYFLRAEKAQPQITLQDVATALKSDLQTYQMNPVAEGEVDASWLTSSGRGLVVQAARSTTLVRGSEVLFERTFEATFAGQGLGLQVKIVADNGQFLLFLAVSVLGAQLAIPPIAISGNQQLEVPLGVLGARLTVSINDWRLDPGYARFNLGLGVVTSMWFVPPVTIAQVPVALPIGRQARALPAVTSPADLVALLALNGSTPGQPKAPEPIVKGYRDPRLQVFSSGVAGWGPNWREDRLIRPFANTPRPEGIQRMHVEIGPQRGSGNVYVVGWASAQETDFDFILHMGNNFFGGWGEIDWRVVGFYYNESPFPRAPKPAPKHLNGNGKHSNGARAPEEEFPMEPVEAGGSYRA